MNYHKIIKASICDGIGVRCTLYLSGCNNHCKGCHNPETWDFNSGFKFDENAKKELFSQLEKPYIQGLTLSGGDPLCSYDEVLELVKEIKTLFPTKDIWLYTGYTLEELYETQREAILEYIDVLVDGRFILEEKDLTIAFRGSRNQRILEKGKDF
jgi:anaerobic ribonucleoside-triphosphate reductase activating protein